VKKLKKEENGDEDLDEEDEPEGEEDEEEEFAEGEDDLDEADGMFYKPVFLINLVIFSQAIFSQVVQKMTKTT